MEEKINLMKKRFKHEGFTFTEKQERQFFQPPPHRTFVCHRQQVDRQCQMSCQAVQKSNEKIA